MPGKPRMHVYVAVQHRVEHTISVRSKVHPTRNEYAENAQHTQALNKRVEQSPHDTEADHNATKGQEANQQGQLAHMIAPDAALTHRLAYIPARGGGVRDEERFGEVERFLMADLATVTISVRMSLFIIFKAARI
jgi:hypothetical protein